jgi:SAM-dependent methyltransferase
MEIENIIELTKTACDTTADKYHEKFKNEIEQKDYDRLLLDKFSDMLEAGSLLCDAGCGPSGHIGKYLHDKGHKVVGIDISQKCIDKAISCNPGMVFQCMDMMHTDFQNDSFDALLSFYSVVHTPKEYMNSMFAEFRRILKKGGKLIIAVKKGTSEGMIDDEWYEGNKVYFSYFVEEELKKYLLDNNFKIEYFNTRKPYDFEIDVDRSYAIGIKKS